MGGEPDLTDPRATHQPQPLASASPTPRDVALVSPRWTARRLASRSGNGAAVAALRAAGAQPTWLATRLVKRVHMTLRRWLTRRRAETA